MYKVEKHKKCWQKICGHKLISSIFNVLRNDEDKGLFYLKQVLYFIHHWYFYIHLNCNMKNVDIDVTESILIYLTELLVSFENILFRPVN